MFNETINMQLHIIILAAGKGTRMKSKLPKALHTIGGLTLLEHVVMTAKLLRPQQVHVIYGSGADLVRSKLNHLDVNWILQEKQLGTGHAVQQVLPCIENGNVLILCCDVPLISEKILRTLLNELPEQEKGIAILTAELDDPQDLEE